MVTHRFMVMYVSLVGRLDLNRAHSGYSSPQLKLWALGKSFRDCSGRARWACCSSFDIAPPVACNTTLAHRNMWFCSFMHHHGAWRTNRSASSAAVR